jgi:hypothetical protein
MSKKRTILLLKANQIGLMYDNDIGRGSTCYTENVSDALFIFLFVVPRAFHKLYLKMHRTERTNAVPSQTAVLPITRGVVCYVQLLPLLLDVS